jgi:predicted metal-dependent hydrolase
MTQALQVDDLRFELRRSGSRRTVGLTVDRNGELVIAAPLVCSMQALEDFIRSKRFWIYTKLAEKEALKHAARPRQFVGGEGFPYLGRSYRLQLVSEQDIPLKLVHGRFLLRRSDAAGGRACFIRWYVERGTIWLERRVPRFASRIGAAPTNVEVRDLGFRWGSCGRAGNVSFHWATILLPPAVIDYVIVHELAHLLEARHTPRFWAAVERVMPDYESRRSRIAELGRACADLFDSPTSSRSGSIDTVSNGQPARVDLRRGQETD